MKTILKLILVLALVFGLARVFDMHEEKGGVAFGGQNDPVVSLASVDLGASVDAALIVNDIEHDARLISGTYNHKLNDVYIFAYKDGKYVGQVYDWEGSGIFSLDPLERLYEGDKVIVKISAFQPRVVAKTAILTVKADPKKGERAEARGYKGEVSLDVMHKGDKVVKGKYPYATVGKINFVEVTESNRQSYIYYPKFSPSTPSIFSVPLQGIVKTGDLVKLKVTYNRGNSALVEMTVTE